MPAVLAILFTSGCTVPGLDIEIPFIPDIFGTNVEVQQHDVIVIERIDAIPSATVTEGNTVTLRTIIKNVQKAESHPQENVIVKLYDTCGLFEVRQDSFCSLCREGSLNEDGNGNSYFTIEEMYPKSDGVINWVLKAEEVKIKTPCKLGILVQYDYLTPSSYKVMFMDKDELDRLVSQGETPASAGLEGSIGEGPVKAYMEVPGQPIPVSTNLETGKINTAIFSFWLENNGGGYINTAINKNNAYFQPGYCDGKLQTIEGSNDQTGQKKICISISGSGLEVENYASLSGCLEKKILGDEPSQGKINFIGKSTPKYSCEIRPNVQPSQLGLQKTFQIQAEVKYSYIYTANANLVVEPRIRLE